MKATGIVRRIDDLGRIVVPKEIRRTLRIREGDPLEIYTDREGEIILKKYSPIGELSTFAKIYADSLSQTTGCTVCITDRDRIIAASGSSKKEFVEKQISKELDKLIEDRENLMALNDEKRFIKISENDVEYSGEVIAPIINQGDAIGAVVLLAKTDKDKIGDIELKLAMTASDFLGRQMEQ